MVLTLDDLGTSWHFLIFLANLLVYDKGERARELQINKMSKSEEIFA